MIAKSSSRGVASFLHSMLKNTTVEPVFLLYAISSGLGWVIRPNLLIDKACLQHLNFTKEVCDDLLDNPDYKEELNEVTVMHWQ